MKDTVDTRWVIAKVKKRRRRFFLTSYENKDLVVVNEQGEIVSVLVDREAYPPVIGKIVRDGKSLFFFYDEWGEPLTGDNDPNSSYDPYGDLYFRDLYEEYVDFKV